MFFCFTFIRLESKNLHLSTWIQPAGGRKAVNGWLMFCDNIWRQKDRPKKECSSLFSFIIDNRGKPNEENQFKMFWLTTASSMQMTVGHCGYKYIWFLYILKHKRRFTILPLKKCHGNASYFGWIIGTCRIKTGKTDVGFGLRGSVRRWLQVPAVANL